MSKKQSHTPGPWTIEDTKDSIFILSDDSAVIALSDFSDDVPTEQTVSNARLIAAAPEMLEALELILHYVNEGDETLASVLVDEIKSTIAKARGET